MVARGQLIGLCALLVLRSEIILECHRYDQIAHNGHRRLLLLMRCLLRTLTVFCLRLGQRRRAFRRTQIVLEVLVYTSARDQEMIAG